jgi:hypothetical protein
MLSDRFQDFLTEEYVAREILAVKVESLRRMRVLGRGPKATKVGRRVLFHVDDIRAYLNQCRQTAD